MSKRPKIVDPTELKWPVIDNEKEEAILKTLENIFSKYKSCLRTIKKPPKWKKMKEEKEDSLTEEEGKQRNIFKSWFVVGTQTVMKGLERNNLSAVILWREVQPAVLRKAFLQLVSQQGCPAVCVTDLLTPLQKSWPGLTSASTLGILKTEDPNDFEELVTMIRSHAPKVTVCSTTDIKLSEEPLVISDNGEKKTIPKTVSAESGSETEIGNKTVGRPTVNAGKYYIYKSGKATGTSKSFSGQSFIAFDDDPGCSVIETIKGVRVQKGTEKSESLATFGIRPSLGGVGSMDNLAAVTGDTKVAEGKGENFRKRNAMDSESGYKRINLMKLQNNIQKKKKMKKKNKKK